MKQRPTLRPVSEEMTEWAADLDRELTSWPGVTRRQMFGMIVFYRRSTIFAALPRTKSFEPANSVAFKLYAPVKGPLDDSRIVAPEKVEGWIVFVLRSSNDLNGALKWFAVAYQHCFEAKRKIKRSSR